MRPGLAIAAGVIASAAALDGCSAPTTGPTEPVETTSSPIENGSPINNTGDIVSTLFPLTTVGITTPNIGRCTGVILSVAPVTKILTAAHCRTNAQSQVWLYPSGYGLGNTPNLTHPLPVAGPPDLQSGLGVCDENVAGSVPSTCTSDGGTEQHLADLAVLTLVTPLTSPFRRVILAPQAALATKVTTWAVGTGMVNLSLWAACDASTDDLNVLNPSRKMWWVPADPLTQINTPDRFGTNRFNTDQGDSGGPAYQLMSDNLLVGADGYNLQLVGILSNGTCGGGSGYDEYTSTQDIDNYNWLVGEGGSPTSFLVTSDGGFGVDDASSDSEDAASDEGGEGEEAAAPTPTGGVNLPIAEASGVEGSSNGSGCAIAGGAHSSGESLAPLAALTVFAARRRRARSRRPSSACPA